MAEGWGGVGPATFAESEGRGGRIGRRLRSQVCEANLGCPPKPPFFQKNLKGDKMYILLVTISVAKPFFQKFLKSEGGGAVASTPQQTKQNKKHTNPRVEQNPSFLCTNAYIFNKSSYNHIK